MATLGGHYPRPAPIEVYGNGGFRFAGMSHKGSLLILPSGIHAWEAVRVEELALAHFARVIAERAAIGILLLGCGRRLELPPAEVAKALRAEFAGIEFADTGAACRTYNVLLAEARPVAAALIAVD